MPCAHFTVPPPTFSGEQTNSSTAESLGSDRRANDIHHGIHGAHFVEVNFLNIVVVDLGFGAAQRLENGDRSLFRAFADAGLAE